MTHIDHRILPRHQRFAEQVRDHEKIARIVEGGSADQPRQTSAKRIGNRSGEGDPHRMRGLPIYARGVPGMSTESARLLRQVENQSFGH